MAKSFEITNLAAFEKALDNVVHDTRRGVRNLIIGISQRGLRELQRATPRDTSRAAASWNNTVDSPPSEWKQPEGLKHYQPPPFKDTRTISFDSLINISNNIEYIIPLERGHSKQRKFFVRDTVAALTAQLTSEARKESRRKVK